MAVQSELRKRQRLEDVDNVEDVVKLILSSKNIMILAGAGLIPSVCLYLVSLSLCFCVLYL